MHASRVIIVLAALAATGCGSGSNATPTPSPVGADVSAPGAEITRLLSLETSGLAEPTELVVRDAAALQALWARLHTTTPAPAVPAVDFAQRMVVVVGLGERPTGGHAARIDAVTPEGAGAVVRYTASAPGQGCMTTQVITAPVEVVSVPRATGTVRFERRQATTSC